MSELDQAATAEASLNAALVPILWVVSPIVFVVGLIWTQIERP